MNLQFIPIPLRKSVSGFIRFSDIHSTNVQVLYYDLLISNINKTTTNLAEDGGCFNMHTICYKLIKSLNLIA